MQKFFEKNRPKIFFALILLFSAVLVKYGLGSLLLAPKPSPPPAFLPVTNTYNAQPTPYYRPSRVDFETSFTNRYSSLPVFELQPAPYALFSPEGARLIAQALGFSAQAQATVQNNLYLYFEQDQKLSINKLAGIIEFATDSRNLTQTGPITKNEALAVVKRSLQAFNLDQSFYAWDAADEQTYAVKEGVPQLTSLQSEIAFLELKPQIKVDEYEFVSPVPILAWVSADKKLVALSIWYPNLASDQPENKELLTVEEAKALIKEGKGSFVLGQAQRLDQLKLTHVKIIYSVDLNDVYDFSQTRYIKPFYEFSGPDGSIRLSALRQDFE